MNIAVLIVTYNPDFKSLLNNIQSYYNQATIVLVVDNSTDLASQNKVNSLSNHFNNIKIIQNKENLGIAKAQNIGLKYLLDIENADFIVEIDQDSSLFQTYIQDILESYKELTLKYSNIACLGPIAINSKNGEVYDGYKKDSGVLQVDYTLSSGLLIKAETLRKIGIKEEKLFIDLVDWEWCWRAEGKGYLTFVDTNLYISHSLGERHLKFLIFRFGVPNAIRHYYAFRNSLYLITKGFVPIKWKFKTLVLMGFKIIVYPFILPNGFARFKYMLKGIRDFTLSRYGIYSQS